MLSSTVVAQSALRRSRRTVSSLLLKSKQHQQIRCMGGGGGGGYRYWVPVVPQSEGAKMFEGHANETEGWETSMYITTALTLAMTFVYATMGPQTDIQVWARNEAAARLILKEKHGFTDFEFGKHYQDEVYVQSREVAWDELQKKFCNPFKDEDDEDEDDEDEEEEDDEDDE